MCVAKDRSIKDIGLRYNNLYNITMKNCVQGANIINHYVHTFSSYRCQWDSYTTSLSCCTKIRVIVLLVCVVIVCVVYMWRVLWTAVVLKYSIFCLTLFCMERFMHTTTTWPGLQTMGYIKPSQKFLIVVSSSSVKSWYIHQLLYVHKHCKRRYTTQYYWTIMQAIKLYV